MPSKKKISKTGPSNNNGKTSRASSTRTNKTTVKFTMERSKADIENMKKLMRMLNAESFGKQYHTDSKLYRDLPEIYMNAVKRIADQQLEVDELTAKLDTLEDLRTSFRRIFELCELKK